MRKVNSMPARRKAKLTRSDLIALVAVSFMAGFTAAFSMMSHSAARRIEAVESKNSDAKAFMAAAKSPDIWDSLLGQSK